MFAACSGAAILGGNNSSRFSYWMAEPKEVFEFCAGEIEPFEKLQKVLNRYELEATPADLPKGIFVGGWVGYFSYELGRYIEKLPERAIDDLKMPLIRLCFYDRVIVYDRMENAWWVIVVEMPDDTESPQSKIKNQITKIEKINPNTKMEQITAKGGCATRALSNMSKGEYLNAIEKIRHYIHEGDVYQINFSHRFKCDYNARPIDLYHWQNEHNPSPYSAYIDAGDFTIVSASPEMFITISDRVISTKPIKGTRPRCGTGILPVNSMAETAMPHNLVNEWNFNELLHCKKEQAELNMIIDLERNDLGRICKYGTIKVAQPRMIEEYPTVFHAVATVKGKLRDEMAFCDVLKAMFPGGSITVAPKIRSMEIIDELEPTQRGVYTGSIGFIGIDGTVCLNIAIRTVIIRNGKAYAQTGGGIVYDSKPESEWDETLTKAKALLEGIEAVNENISE